MKKMLGIAVSSLLLVACGEPKIDISSDQALKHSIQTVRNSLPHEKQPLFDDALSIITLSQISMETLERAGVKDGSSVIEEQLKRALAGKTAEDIIAYAEILSEH